MGSIFARKQRKARKRNAVPWTPKPEEEAPLIGADDQFGAILPAGDLAPGRITMMANADMGRHSSARSQKKSQLLALKNSVRSKKSLTVLSDQDQVAINVIPAANPELELNAEQ